MVAPAVPILASGAASWHILQRSFSAVTIGITFQTDEIGWTSHTDGASLPQIVKTHDGGATWNQVQNVTGVSALTTSMAAQHGSKIDVATTGALESSVWSLDGERFTQSIGAPIVSQDIKREGNHFMIAGPNGPCIGSLGGLRYKCTKVPLETPGTGRYASRPNGGDVIYFAAGSWPSDSTEKVVQVGAEQHHRLTRNVRVIDGRKMEVSPEEVSNDAATDYSAELWKSTDGGNTWTKLMSDTGNFYFNDIHCYDETNCVAVAEGFGETGGETGARVYRTTDGETFEKVLHKDDTHAESLMTTKMLSASEYWVGGSTKPGALVAPSLILHSVDGGATHTDESSGILGQMMTSMDCLSAEHCYATSITAVQTCNLLEFGGNNPPAPSPTPTPGVSHYEQPPCQDGEAQASVTGTDGALCAPPCDASGSCPTDVPDGVTAGPQCVLKDQSGNQYCALICSSDDECDTAGGSSCQYPSAGQPGLCTYPTSSANAQLSFLNQAVTV